MGNAFAHQEARVDRAGDVARAATTERSPLAASNLVLLTERAPDRARWHRPLLGILTVGRTPSRLRSSDAAIEEGARDQAGMLHDKVFRRSLALADIFATLLAGLAVVVLLARESLRPAALLVLPVVILAGKLLGSYDRDELLVNKTTLDEAPRLFYLATLIALLFAVFEHRFLSAPLAPAALVGLWISMFCCLVALRCVARAFARTVTMPERCLFVGTEESVGRLRAKLDSTGGNAVLVGWISTEDQDGSGHLADVASALQRVVDELRINRVIIEPSDPHPQSALDFVREAKGTGARVSLLPRVLEVVGSSIEIDDVHGLTLLGVRQFGLSRSSMILKRSFDIAGATIALILTAPAMAVFALLIKLDSRGPIIYRQTRIGRGGRPFLMWKFRTMVDGADAMKASLQALNEADGLFKIAADPRITRVGGWLRRRSLDELPQLVNVLRGDMSLVGPRPLVKDDDARITGLDRRRLHLTPGMTGRWQILGSARVPLAEMVKLDYLYVTGWSLWSDVKILLRTVPFVLARRGM